MESLKHLRKDRDNLSIRGLAEQAGVSYVTIARIEAGIYDPRLSTLVKLANALDATVAEVIGDQPFKPLTKKGGPKHGTDKTKGRVVRGVSRRG